MEAVQSLPRGLACHDTQAKEKEKGKEEAEKDKEKEKEKEKQVPPPPVGGKVAAAPTVLLRADVCLSLRPCL